MAMIMISLSKHVKLQDLARKQAHKMRVGDTKIIILI